MRGVLLCSSGCFVDVFVSIEGSLSDLSSLSGSSSDDESYLKGFESGTSFFFFTSAVSFWEPVSSLLSSKVNRMNVKCEVKIISDTFHSNYYLISVSHINIKLLSMYL